MTAIADLQGTLTTDGVGGLVNLEQLTLDPFSLDSGKFLRLTLRIDDLAKLDNLFFFVGVGGLTNNIKWRFDATTAVSRVGKNGEVFIVTLQLAEINAVAGTITLSARGAPSVTAGFTAARLQAEDISTGPVQIVLLRTEVVTPTVAGGHVSITFDDSDQSMVTLGYPRMASLGFAGTAYTIVDLIGQAGRATLAELRLLEGWEIAGHAHAQANHDARYTALSAVTVKADLASLHGWLHAEAPLGQKSFSYPGGEYADTTDGVSIETLVAGAGFGSGRTTLAEVGVITHAQVNALPPAMPYRLYAMSSISSAASGVSPAHPTNLIAVGGMLDKVAETGGWLILVFHRIVTGAPAATTEITEEDFNSILAAVAARDLTVLPVRQVMNLIADTAAAIPIPTPATADELLTYLRRSIDPADQPHVVEVLEAATEAAEGWHAVGPIVARGFTDRVTARRGRLRLPRTPVQSVTSATHVLDGTVFVTADLDVDEVSGLVSSKGSWIDSGDYTVVYTAGRDPVPVNLKRAVLMLAGHIWYTQQSPGPRRAAASGQDDSGFRSGAGYLIPHRVAHLLQPYANVLVG